MILMLYVGVGPAAAQRTADVRGSRNVTVVSHLPLGGMQPLDAAPGDAFQGLGRRTGDIEVEQDMERPYVYVAQRYTGFVIVDISDPARPRSLDRWSIDEVEAHRGAGARDVKAFKAGGRHYLVQAFQYEEGPDDDLGAIIFDVTDLPGSIREVARFRIEGGLKHVFVYRHSDGRALLFGTGGGDIYVYDLGRVLAGETGLIGRIASPEQLEVPTQGYEDVYVAYQAEAEQDRLYGAGAGGYFVFDVTDPANPALLTQVNDAAVQRGRTITVSPDGRYAMTAAGYRTAPMRLFDLQPGLDGTIPRVRTAVGAWTADWQNFSQNQEMRWPFVFVAALDDGFQVVNIMDPVNPYTDAYYYTWDGPRGKLADQETHYNGAYDIDVRNADGLVVVSDVNTGFWAFRVEGFNGWDGRGWGLPNISSVQDWDDGPQSAVQW
jgi:hypothetical protein